MKFHREIEPYENGTIWRIPWFLTYFPNKKEREAYEITILVVCLYVAHY
jgi:hypothetical protein